jgi:hypothetical protein
MSDAMLLFLGLRLPEEALTRFLPLWRVAPQQHDLSDLADVLQSLLRLSFKPELRGVPSLDFGLSVEGVEQSPPLKAGDMLVFALAPLDRARTAELRSQLNLAIQEKRISEGHLSVDLPIAPTDVNVWCPNHSPFPLFGQRGLALERIHADAAVAKEAWGNNVNVIIMDQGINRLALLNYFPGARFRGGWIAPEFGRGGPPGPPGPPSFVMPGAWPDGHATKMAETVLSVTPRVNLFDLPLMPSHIIDLGGFLSWAAGVYWLLSIQIPWLKLFDRYSGPWVLCNAWAVYNLATDAPAGDPLNYGQNPLNIMNLGVANLPQAGLADVVFAAGNCGQFCPDGRCGPADIGPGHSIHGVAAIANVLTVGAVRSDNIWLGYSSQGPAPAGFASAKPDLCAPSQFAHPTDWHRSYTGTSAACALATGAVAAARSYPLTQGLTPPALRAHAAATASVPAGASVPNDRLGTGIIDINALL